MEIDGMWNQFLIPFFLNGSLCPHWSPS